MYSYIKNVNWLPRPNKVELHFSETPPAPEKIAAVFVYAFNEQNELLMIQTPDGRWDIPGGGKEGNEIIAQTAQREVKEEAQVTVENIKVIGYQKLSVQGDQHKNGRRPYPECYEILSQPMCLKNSHSKHHQRQKNANISM